MKILGNIKIKKLFVSLLLNIIIFLFVSTIIIFLNLKYPIIYIVFCFLCFSISIFIVTYRYFMEQNRIMEDAINQIKEYISGNRSARIQCNDEGELYRLFHEVNSLVSILNTKISDELKVKEALKNTISDISHQFKTPLAALNIYNGIIEEEASELPTIKEFVALSEKELDRIEMLIKNLLKVAKLDAGVITMDMHNENILEMMSDLEEFYKYRCIQEEKKISLLGDDNITLLCDRNWIVEAISNIIKNAFDHTESGDTIHFEWRNLGAMVQIIISDNGSGICEEDLYHIFKRFYRSRYSKDISGIGLGLPLSKAIIEMHNGTIEIESELGMGTIFTISFPNLTKL